MEKVFNGKIDTDAIGINNKLAKKYNALINFISKNTTLERGCLNEAIASVQYVRRDDPKGLFKTRDYIVIKTKTYGHNLWINNSKALFIDRKWNTVSIVDNLEV